MITGFETLCFTLVLSHSDSRRIYGLLTLVQILQSETSHIPRTLGVIVLNVSKGGTQWGQYYYK